MATFSQLISTSDSDLERVRGGESSPDWNGGKRLEALGNLSHELRTPVQILLGYLDILRSDFPDSIGERPREIIERIHTNAQDLARTVENLMDFAIAQDRAESQVDEPVDLAELIAEVMNALESANESKGLELKSDLSAAPRQVRLRRCALKSILLNLTVNAVKFTERGSVIVTVRALPTQCEAGMLEIVVSDTGLGMDPAQVRDAFRPCRQLSRSSERRYRGIGLGLAVVRRKVASLNGSIDVQTSLAEGSTFTVRLPLPRPISGNAASGQRLLREW